MEPEDICAVSSNQVSEPISRISRKATDEQRLKRGRLVIRLPAIDLGEAYRYKPDALVHGLSSEE